MARSWDYSLNEIVMISTALKYFQTFPKRNVQEYTTSQKHFVIKQINAGTELSIWFGLNQYNDYHITKK